MKFGEWYEVTGKAVKVRQYAGGAYQNTWEHISFELPMRALYVGIRVVYNGRSYYNEMGYTEDFRVEKPLTVCLFVNDPRSDPFCAFKDQVVQEDRADKDGSG